jgi:hypothetical protein
VVAKFYLPTNKEYYIGNSALAFQLLKRLHAHFLSDMLAVA